MKSYFWIALNLIGFVILAFMVTHRAQKQREQTAAQKLFMYLVITGMIFIVFDSGMYLIDGASFKGAVELNYVFSMMYFITSPALGALYILFCDVRISNINKNIKIRAAVCFVPFFLNAVFVALTPVTKLVFYVDEYNIYYRSDLFWVPAALTFAYIFCIYPLLAVLKKRRRVSIPKEEIAYLCLFPLPTVILTVIQILNYGVLLIGFGFVLSTFLLYTNSVQSAEDKRSLAVRSYNLNLIQFAVISSVMMAGMFLILENITEEISTDYAVYSSAGSASVLENYIGKEIGLMSVAAKTDAVVQWLSDETNEEKKHAAYDKLIYTTEALYNNNIYIVAMGSGREYSLDSTAAFESFNPHAAISKDNPKDKWVFDLITEQNEFNLNADYDKQYARTMVWLNMKVMSGDEVIGILATGMDLYDIAEQALFSRTEGAKTRSLIINEYGIINIDSELMSEGEYLVHTAQKHISSEISDSDVALRINEHLSGGLYNEAQAAVIPVRADSRYTYAVIMSIKDTKWTLITLYDSSSLFAAANLLPLFAVVGVMLILFVYSSNRITERLIFTPLKQLINSLVNMRTTNEQNMFGTERTDEIGLLSNAIQDYFVKGYYDELTGIYNRRYLDTTFSQILKTLSRSEYKISVMLIDIDKFKQYNDTYGHAKGDTCLKAVAETLNKAIMRKGDFVARYGGEEFAVVLPHTDEAGAKILAQSMLDAVRELAIPHAKSEHGVVTISIGVTTADNNNVQSADEYLRKADKALYMSKDGGRNRFTVL